MNARLNATAAASATTTAATPSPDDASGEDGEHEHERRDGAGDVVAHRQHEPRSTSATSAMPSSDTDDGGRLTSRAHHGTHLYGELR